MSYPVSRPDADILGESLPPLPEPLARPVLIVVSGLPATGKSYFCRRLVFHFPAAILETDSLRKALFPAPNYSGEESARLFRATHALIEALLQKGIPVVLDATNLVEAHRQHLYRIARQLEAKLIMVRVEAPLEVVRQRLAQRKRASSPYDNSEADWQVYQRMSRSQDPIMRNHLVVDTSRDIDPVIQKVVREVGHWLKV